MFYDESRFGLITDVGRRWTARGVKTIIPSQQKYEYFYLYQVTDIKRGEEFSIEELESKVTEILFSYTKEQIKSLVFYPYLQKAFNVH